MSTTPPPTSDDLMQVMTAVLHDQVHLADDYQYVRITARSHDHVDCTDAVYELEDCGMVELHPDGTVEATTKGRAWHKLRGGTAPGAPAAAPQFSEAAV